MLTGCLYNLRLKSQATLYSPRLLLAPLIQGLRQ